MVATQPNLATASTRLDDWLGRPVRLLWRREHERRVGAA